MFAFASSLNKNNSYSDILKINDTEIFGVGVRIYKPVNRTNQANEPGKQVLLPGLIYFHGGGWTLGSLGKPFFIAFIYPKQFAILYILYVGGPNPGSVDQSNGLGPQTGPQGWGSVFSGRPFICSFAKE